jgi:hypothetical protein
MYDVYFCGDSEPTHRNVTWEAAVKLTETLPRWMDFDIVEVEGL